MTSRTGLDAALATLEDARRRHRAVMSTSGDRAARAVRDQVVEGRLRSGTRLPEERLAAAIGVSRNTLREALSQLVAERILVREPHRGVVVATPSVEDVRDVYRVRRIVEPAALREPPAPGTDVTALALAVDEGRTADAAGDVDGVASANQHFHRAVVALAGSARLDAQMDQLLAEMRLFFHQMSRPDQFHRPYLEQNSDIAELVLAGDRAAAADLLEGYLAGAEEELVEALGP
ncbi:GntR family transcriptional regulator [Solicola sp. PLA-1-18]|uniref:GntR family transcriptional regulator n=1 Tax=Solicola sp. PLA-1-18 TaxID=3380532 RepID=UPI003B822A21